MINWMFENYGKYNFEGRITSNCISSFLEFSVRISPNFWWLQRLEISGTLSPPVAQQYDESIEGLSQGFIIDFILFQ